jgi:hypothetical protein
MSIEALLIECRGCGRRSALGPEELPAVCRGNQASVRDAKFKCRKCVSTPVRSHSPDQPRRSRFFLAGDPMPAA